MVFFPMVLKGLPGEDACACCAPGLIGTLFRLVSITGTNHAASLGQLCEEVEESTKEGLDTEQVVALTETRSETRST